MLADPIRRNDIWRSTHHGHAKWRTAAYATLQVPGAQMSFSRWWPIENEFELASGIAEQYTANADTDITSPDQSNMRDNSLSDAQIV